MAPAESLSVNSGANTDKKRPTPTNHAEENKQKQGTFKRQRTALACNSCR